MAQEDPKQVLGLRLAHVGINGANPADAQKIASELAALLGLVSHEEPPSYFVDSSIEVMKQGGRGTKGHIAFHVDSIPEAQAWFEAKGLAFAQDSRRLREDGSTRLIYFEQEIGGFAIHLTED